MFQSLYKNIIDTICFPLDIYIKVDTFCFLFDLSSWMLEFFKKHVFYMLRRLYSLYFPLVWLLEKKREKSAAEANRDMVWLQEIVWKSAK